MFAASLFIGPIGMLFTPSVWAGRSSSCSWHSGRRSSGRCRCRSGRLQSKVGNVVVVVVVAAVVVVVTGEGDAPGY